MENRILTAEEFIKEGVEGYPLRDVIDNLNDEDIIEIMVDFAKLHVERALKSAIKQAIVIEYIANHYTNETDFRVKEDSILNAYPLEKIR